MSAIFTIDDDKDLCEALSLTLEMQEHKVNKGYSASDLKRLLIAKTPDLIILDIDLPDGSGDEILKDLQTHDTTKEIPVIMLTATVQKKKVIECLEMGAVDYMTKPYHPEELLVRVESALSIKKLALEKESTITMEIMRKTALTVLNELEMPLTAVLENMEQILKECAEMKSGHDDVLREIVNHAMDIRRSLEKHVSPDTDNY
jgi:DNA-binding response OmpR family regulator